ncbi:MAG TPA: glycerophosphodiester phosphodiesterase family protein [Candidatus Acidoferrales bacterium]|nr:glycerophosphodiester phosphodiesterase family protein [Candidatus Acidoferrales bacterium]
MPFGDLIKVAHRGASGCYPENSRLAFEKALEAGVDMIELDCQLSRDGHLVVFHDQRLERLAGVKGTVRGSTLAQLKRLDIGRKFKKSFRGQRIMTLEEAMSLLAGKVDLAVEIKTSRRAPLGIELKVLFVLSYYRYLARSVISSMDYRALERVRELAPQARVGVIHHQGIRADPLEVAARLSAESLHVEKSGATPELIGAARARGLKIFVWTVNEVTEMEKFFALGVDGIISDYPERFWKIKLHRAHG